MSGTSPFFRDPSLLQGLHAEVKRIQTPVWMRLITYASDSSHVRMLKQLGRAAFSLSYPSHDIMGPKTFGKSSLMKLLVARLMFDYREIDPEWLAAARRHYEEASRRRSMLPLTGQGVHSFNMLHVEDDSQPRQVGD